MEKVRSPAVGAEIGSSEQSMSVSVRIRALAGRVQLAARVGEQGRVGEIVAQISVNGIKDARAADVSQSDNVSVIGFQGRVPFEGGSSLIDLGGWFPARSPIGESRDDPPLEGGIADKFAIQLAADDQPRPGRLQPLEELSVGRSAFRSEHLARNIRIQNRAHRLESQRPASFFSEELAVSLGEAAAMPDQVAVLIPTKRVDADVALVALEVED
ncbi:hypothetical protein [Candidatus Palauibacter sp.]|uniref:hypothetical protein n=1 Tax=Candidatus Palauibacter sp. TaxID=3101350 RepID=UPI003CC5EE96